MRCPDGSRRKVSPASKVDAQQDPDKLSRARRAADAATTGRWLSRARSVVTRGSAAVVLGVAIGGCRDDGQPPVVGSARFAESIDVTDLDRLTVSYKGSLTRQIVIGLRPGGRPGFCASMIIGALTGKARCIETSDQGARIPLLPDNGSVGAVGIEPRAVAVRLRYGKSSVDVPITPVPTIPGGFAVIWPQELGQGEKLVSSLVDSKGRVLATSPVLPRS